MPEALCVSGRPISALCIGARASEERDGTGIDVPVSTSGHNRESFNEALIS
jgi:hypothetical protein